MAGAARDTWSCDAGANGAGAVGPSDSPHDGIGASLVVVKGVVVDGVATAVEVIRQVDERAAAVEQ